MLEKTFLPELARLSKAVDGKVQSMIMSGWPCIHPPPPPPLSHASRVCGAQESPAALPGMVKGWWWCECLCASVDGLA